MVTSIPARMLRLSARDRSKDFTVLRGRRLEMVVVGGEIHLLSNRLAPRDGREFVPVSLEKRGVFWISRRIAGKHLSKPVDLVLAGKRVRTL